MSAFWIFLLLFTGVVLTEKTCSFQEVLDHLKLKRNEDLFYMTRPVKDHRQATLVSMEMCLYAILDVVEKDQKFIPYVWTVIKWPNDFIRWNKTDFCGIEKVSIPIEVLWKPDLTIEEMTEKDKAPPSPHMFISSDGEVEIQNDQVLVSTCRMRVHKFPFDTQSCNLSFKSVIHTAKDIRLVASENSSEATEQSLEVMRMQYEWLFINIAVTNQNASSPEEQDIVIYTINMKRRPVLYIVNFLLPVLFFLCLDLASFMISHGGGEKLTFKVTVLLAVTVLQLILNEILPSSSDKIPLIATYCIVNFALMLVSLLETIVVMYLMKKDTHVKMEDIMGCLSEDKHMTNNIFHRGRAHSTCIYDSSTGETTTGHLEIEDPHSTKVSDECCTLEKILDHLKCVERSLLILDRHHQDNPGEWTQLAKKINKIFFILYVVVVISFLAYIYIEWNNDAD